MVGWIAAKTSERVPLCEPATILVVGDIIYDLYLGGTMHDTTTAPVFSDVSRLESLGGAANAAANLAASGNDVRLVGVVGADAAGRRTRELLRERGIADTFVLEDITRATTQRTYLAAEGRTVLRMDHESRNPLSIPFLARLRECVDALLWQVDAVVCADSGKGVCAAALIDPLLAAARSAGRPVFVDCSGHAPERYHEATALVMHVDAAQRRAGQVDVAHSLLEQSWAQVVCR
jgi:D-beta-D-heptose 7-phosphate kinase/D-beta-D-heptose 1-phosphate adenosyltransferase